MPKPSETSPLLINQKSSDSINIESTPRSNRASLSSSLNSLHLPTFAKSVTEALDLVNGDDVMAPRTHSIADSIGSMKGVHSTKSADDLLSAFELRAAEPTSSFGNYYRPTIWEYEDTMRNRFGISDEIDETLERGRSFMIDLKTKKQGVVSLDQVLSFGTSIRPKVKEHVRNVRNSFSETPIMTRKNTEKESKPSQEPKLEKTILQEDYDGDSEIPFRYWVDVLNPTSEQIEELQQALGFHPLTSEDLLLKGTREKLEEYPSYLYLVFNERQRVPNSNRYRDVNMNLLIFPPGIIVSIHLLPVKSLTQVMYHVQHGTMPADVTVDWVAYKFLDMITDEFVLMVDAIYREVDYLDTMVSDVGDEDKEDVLRRIGVARQRLTQLRGSLLSKREILSTLASTVRTSVFIKETTKIYFRDVMDHVVLMIQRLDMANEMLNNTSSLYLAMISIEIAATDHKMNEAMKCFGAVVTIVLPLTVITGMWGMNVQVPGQTGIAPDGNLWFLAIILGFVIWIVTAAIVFKYKRWL